MKVLITSIEKVTCEGVHLRLNKPASLNGRLKADQVYVSWDKIGRALYGDQYSNAKTVAELSRNRGGV